MRDEDFGSTLTLTEADGGLWSPPVSEPPDRPSLYEQALARAEELRWAEVTARSDAAVWKSRFKACRQRLSEAEQEAKDLRRTAKDVPSLQGRSGAPGGVALRSPHWVEPVPHDRSASRGGRAPAKGSGIESPEGRDRAGVQGEHPAAQGPGTVAGAKGRTRGVARRGLDAAQIGAHRADGAVEGEYPAGQGAGAVAGAEGTRSRRCARNCGNRARKRRG